MNARRLLAGLWLWLVLAIMTTGCGTGNLAAPTDEPIPEPSLVVTPTNSYQQYVAERWWAKQALCVGVAERVLGYKFPVRVLPDAFDCSGVSAAGCMRYTSIEVVDRWFEMAIAHEWIHFALWKKGGEDIGHSNPAFARCDPNAKPSSELHVVLYADHVGGEVF